MAEVQKEVEGLLSRTDVQDLQPSLGQLAAALVSRSLGEEAFYTPSILAQLVQTRCLCHRSVKYSPLNRLMKNELEDKN